MTTEILIIYITIFVVISLVFVINSNSTIFSLLFLVFSFILAAIILLLLDCDFLAFIFFIVYIGAIIVLFLFVLMLLDIKFKNLSKTLIIDFLIGYLYIFLLYYLICYPKLYNFSFFSYYFNNLKPIRFINWKFLINSNYKIKVYANILYTYFVLEFLLIGIFLLLVLIGIIFIMNNYLSLNIKIQNNIKQLSIKSKFFY